MPIFSKYGQSFQKAQKSWGEGMRVRCQRSRWLCIDGLLVRLMFAYISSHFWGCNIRPTLIGQKSVWNQLKTVLWHFFVLTDWWCIGKERKKSGQNPKIWTQAVWSTDRSFLGGGRSGRLMETITSWDSAVVFTEKGGYVLAFSTCTFRGKKARNGVATCVHLLRRVGYD